MKRGLIALLSIFILITNVSAYEIFYYHSDNLGSPIAITNQTGDVVWRADYKPFGQSFNEVGNNSYKYNSKELDKSGLHYYGARYYDADIGRFTTADTVKGDIKAPQTLNRYVYTLNNPLKYVDPSGKQEENKEEFFQTLGQYRILGEKYYSINEEVLEGAQHATEFSSQTGETLVDLSIGLIPVVGDAQAGIEAIRGEDIFGNRLNTLGRVLALASVVLPFKVNSRILRTTDEVANVADVRLFFRKRVSELTKNEQDLWISQWELSGLIKEFEERGFIINYGKKYIAETHGTFPKHINIAGRNKYDKLIEKHLFITEDPEDIRLFYYGEFNSKAYHPKHPRDVETPNKYLRK